MEIVQYNKAFEKEWEHFITFSVNGTFMQERRFINYHPEGKFLDHSLLFFENTQLQAVLPAAVIEQQNKQKVLVSHPGASHGGIIVKPTFSVKKSREAVRLLLEHCAAEKFSCIRLKPVPRIYQKDLADQLDFALKFAGFKVEYTELATALDLQKSKGDIIKSSLSPSAFRNYQKALKCGLEINEDGDISEYWPILVKKLKDSHNAVPTHTLSEIEHLKKLYPDKIKLFAAYSVDQMSAGVLVFLLNQRVINCFYIAHDDQFQQMRPLNLIFAYLMKWGQENNFQFLDWGISTEDKGSRVNNNLFRFKESFGGHGVLRESYIYEF